jgi:hypothetical protein
VNAADEFGGFLLSALRIAHTGLPTSYKRSWRLVLKIVHMVACQDSSIAIVQLVSIFYVLHRETGDTSATLLALPIHTSINDAGLSVGHFGTLRSTRYRYSDVTKITVTDGLRLRDGSLQQHPAITLGFENGTRWSSADNRDPETQSISRS